MKKILPFVLVFMLFMIALAHATTSTINTVQPVQGAPLASAPIRNNFVAAANDINNLWATVQTAASGPVFLGQSAASTNPFRQNELSTGIYSAGSGQVSFSSLGTNVGTFSSTGLTANVGLSTVTATNTSTPLTLAAQFSNQYYLSQFGAKCDGSTDDTNAITSALANCSSSGGGDIHFQGTCVASQITMPSYCLLDGGNVSTSELKQKSGTNTDFITSYNFSTYTGTGDYYPNTPGVPIWFGLANTRVNSNGNTGRDIAWYGSAYGLYGTVYAYGGSNGCIYTEGPVLGNVGIWQDQEEGWFDTVIANNCGTGDDWDFRGPKDARIKTYLGILVNSGGYGFHSEESSNYLGYIDTADSMHVYANYGTTNRQGFLINAPGDFKYIYGDSTQIVIGTSAANSTFGTVLPQGVDETGDNTSLDGLVVYANDIGVDKIVGNTGTLTNNLHIVNWQGSYGHVGSMNLYDSGTNSGLKVSGSDNTFDGLMIDHFENTGSICVENAGSYNVYNGQIQDCKTIFKYTSGSQNKCNLLVYLNSGQTDISGSLNAVDDCTFDEAGAAANGNGFHAFAQGNVSYPTLTFSNDRTSGIYQSATHVLNFGTNSAEGMHIDANQNLVADQIVEGPNLALNTNVLQEYATNANAQVAVNYTGYNFGTTQYRDFDVFNGKSGTVLFAQGSTGYIGIGSSTPRAVLDISQNNGAMILPIGTTTQEPASPVAGMLRYNTTKTAVEGYIGTAWSALSTTTGTVTSIATTAPLSGGTITSTGTLSITGAAGEVLAGSGPAFSAAPVLGVNASLSGTLGLANGSANGTTITIQNLGNITTGYNFNLPITAGSSGNLLASGGGSSTSMTWDTTTGSGTVVALQTSPTFITPTLGAALATSINALVLSAPSADSTVGHTIAVGTGTLGGAGGSAAYYNTAVGYDALNTAPSTTAAVGNTGVGALALQNITSGTDNTAVGYNAGFDANTSYSTEVGVNANQYPATGDVVIGAFASDQGSGGSNVIIGYNAASAVGSNTESNTTIVGYQVGEGTVMTGSHNILIGTSSTCDVSSGGASGEFHLCGSTTDSVKITGMGTQATEAVTIYGTVTLPNVASSTSALNYMCYNSGNGLTTYDSSGTCLASLEELKDIIAPITSIEALSEVEKLRPFWGKYKDSVTGVADHRVHPMLGAHQVEGIDSRLSSYDGDGNLHGVRYMEMTALIIAAVQEQQKEIEALSPKAFPFHKCFFGILMCAD